MKIEAFLFTQICMPFFCYILFSEERNSFYIGSTGDDLNERLRKHNSNHKGFTGSVADWKFVYTQTFSSVSEARKRELQIKKWKNRAAIERLIRTSTHPSAGSDLSRFIGRVGGFPIYIGINPQLSFDENRSFFVYPNLHATFLLHFIL